jgi:restriction endonuclease Mrr
MRPSGSKLKESLPTRASIRPVMISILESRGGEATVSDLDEAVADHFNLTLEQRSIVRSGNRTEFAYRCAWVRSEAKRDGWLTQPRPRTWALVEKTA